MASPPGSEALNTTRKFAADVIPKSLSERVRVWDAPVKAVAPMMTSAVPFHDTIPNSVVEFAGLCIVKIVFTAPSPVPGKSSAASIVSDALALEANPSAAATANPNFVLRLRIMHDPS
jgi:hypothetical protein